MLPSAFLRSWLVSASVVGVLHAVEGVLDLGLAGGEGGAVGEKAEQRNDGEHHDAGADRQSRDQAKRGEFHEPDVSRGAPTSPRATEW